LALLTGVFIARLLGPEQYGVYAYVMAIVSLLSIPALFGLPQLIVRETAKAKAQGRWGMMRGLWRWCSQLTIFLTVIIFIVTSSIVYMIYDRFYDKQLITMFFGVLLVPFMTLVQLRSAALRGLNKVIQGQLPEAVLRPTLFLVLIGVIISLDVRINAPYTMAVNVLASLISFVVGAWLLRLARPEELRKKPEIVIHSREWLKSALPLALTSTLLLVNQNIDIIMIGWFGSASDVGIYRVATSGAGLVVFGLSTINLVVGPYYAQFHANGDLVKIQKLATISSRVIMLTTLPVVFAFILFGESLIYLIFGPKYVSAYISLSIISVGQLINAVFGSVGLLLAMTDNEKEIAKGVAVATIANIVFNIVLIPLIGIVGAAVATAVTLFVWNFLLWIAVVNKIGVDTMAIPMAKRFKFYKKK